MKFKTKLSQFLNQESDYFLTQGSYLGIGHIISTLCAFLLAIAFAHFLPKEIYGQYRYILSVMAVLVIFTLPGLRTAVIQAVARGFEGSFKKAIRIRLKWGMLTSLASLGLAIYFWLQNDLNSTIAFLIAGVLFPISISLDLYSNYLIGKKLFGEKIRYESFIKIFSLIILVVTLFLTNNLIILVLVYFLSSFLLNSIFFLKTLKKFPPNKKEDPKTISYGKHLSIVEALSSFAAYLDRILIYALLGPVELAIYSFAIIPVEQTKGLLKNIRLLALPKFSTETRRDLKRNIIKRFWKFLLLIAILIIVYIIITPYLYKIFFPQYTDSIFYSQIFVLSLIGMPVFLFLATLEAKMMKKELYKLYSLGSIIQIIAIIILIPLFGIMGAILARIISRILSLLVSFLLTKKYL